MTEMGLKWVEEDEKKKKSLKRRREENRDRSKKRLVDKVERGTAGVGYRWFPGVENELMMIIC